MTYVGAVRAALTSTGGPERAAQQQAYMKSELPFVGLGAAELKALLKPLLAEHRFIDRALWEDAVRELWDDATHREEWYAAIALLRSRHHMPVRRHDKRPVQLRDLLHALAHFRVGQIAIGTAVAA